MHEHACVMPAAACTFTCTVVGNKAQNTQ